MSLADYWRRQRPFDRYSDDLERLARALENAHKHARHKPAVPLHFWTVPRFTTLKSGAVRMEASVLCDDGLVYDVYAYYCDDDSEDLAWPIKPGHLFPGPVE